LLNSIKKFHIKRNSNFLGQLLHKAALRLTAKIRPRGNNNCINKQYSTPIFLCQGGKTEFRKVPVPPNRYGPLKENWMKIFTPIVEHLHLQVRFNLKSRNVEIKVCFFYLMEYIIFSNGSSIFSIV